VSFAYLVYASAWLKLHYPAAFTAGLLDGQPMGFWSPQTIVADARRHGVVVRGPDVNASGAKSRLEAPAPGSNAPVVRLGLSYVRHIGDDLAERIAAAQPFAGVEDLVRRTGVTVPQAEALATAGGLGCFHTSRREALWVAGAAAQAGPDLSVAVGVRRARLAGLVTGAEPPALPGMTPVETNRADLWATGLSPDRYPTEFVREALTRAGVVTAAGLAGVAHGGRVRVAGVVTHRQRPATAAGITFLNLEDETGLINVICHTGVWARYRRPARSAPALVVDGRLERVEGVVALLAERIEALALGSAALRSRDFR
jgi:error-prone DNA polymerase